jgi:hypothetical protein
VPLLERLLLTTHARTELTQQTITTINNNNEGTVKKAGNQSPEFTCFFLIYGTVEALLCCVFVALVAFLLLPLPVAVAAVVRWLLCSLLCCQWPLSFLRRFGALLSKVLARDSFCTFSQ